MIQHGERAPSFTLPGIRDGAVGEISLDDHIGDDVVVLAFYPGDFNPGCTDSAADLNDLDLFTMQKDLTLLAISGDSVHSHRAFAEQYGIDVPLLSDLRGEVAESYGVDAADEAGYLTQRAIVVIDHQGTVEYTWLADDVTDLYDTEALREAIQDVGSDETAVARYRVGHAHYIEGRRGFTRAMKAYGDRDWMMAQGDFKQASEEFDEARSEFNTAVRFSEDDEALKYYERAETKAEALWRAADWLRESASSFSSGQGAKAESLRSDAEAPLEAARDIHEPPDPDDFPPESDPAESDSGKGAGTDRKAYLERDREEVDTSLELDEDVAVDADDATGSRDDVDAVAANDAGAGPADDGAGPADAGDDRPPEPDGQPPGGVDASVGSDAGTATDSGSFARGGGGRPGDGTGDGDAGDDTEGVENGDASDSDGIDEEEIEEIAAEIEEKTEAARERQTADDAEDNAALERGQSGERPDGWEPADVDAGNGNGAGDSPPEDRPEGSATKGPDSEGSISKVPPRGPADDSDDSGVADDAGDSGVADGAGDFTAADDTGGTAPPEEAHETADGGVAEDTEDGDEMDLDLDLTDPTDEPEDQE